MLRWPTWGCDVSKFPWSYSENETCFLLEGRVIVTPDGEDECMQQPLAHSASVPAPLAARVWS